MIISTVKTNLDHIPKNLRFEAQLRENDSANVSESVIEAIDEYYEQKSTFMPYELLESGRDDDRDILIQRAVYLQKLLRGENSPLPAIEKEAFFLASGVAQFLESKTLHPLIEKTDTKSDLSIDDEEFSQIIRETVEIYLDSNITIDSFIHAHLDRISFDDFDLSQRRPTAMIIAGFSFLAIEIQNGLCYRDEKILKGFESQF